MHVLTRKGYSAEHFVVYDLIEKDFIPCMPTIPSSEFDIIAVKGDVRIKIQVKSSAFKDNRMKVDLRKSKGSASRNYTEDDIDCYAIFDRENRDVAYLPADKYLGKTFVTLYREFPKSLNGFNQAARESITLFSELKDLAS